MVNAPIEPPARPRMIDNPLREGLRIGSLEVRLARGQADVQAVQALRYRVFYEEMTARPTADMANLGRDFDDFDKICDHLLVIDHDREASGAVVGTYRLLRRSKAPGGGGFYTANEYDIGKLLSLDGEIVELGRSCVDPGYRGGGAIQLLLRGIGAYITYFECVAMFGCASLPGNSVEAVAEQLSYLHHRHRAPEAIRPRALPERFTAMDLIPAAELDERRAQISLPPLIKGYLRAGCTIGDGAVIDEQFQTIDVCVVLHMDVVTAKFRSRYAEPGARA